MLFSFKMEVWSDEISDWDTTPADKCVSQPPLFCARFSKLGHSSRFTIEYVRTLEKLDMLKSFSQYYPSGGDNGQTFNYGNGGSNSGSLRDDYDNPEDLWEDNQDWYEDEDEAWDEWENG